MYGTSTNSSFIFFRIHEPERLKARQRRVARLSLAGLSAAVASSPLLLQFKGTQRECYVGILSSYPTGSGMNFFFILEKTPG
ncbi:hypothetical protein [Paenibacillus uliginis]|uniref:hypothetical protein n=1 Tax=Paenibacillus uliginis TaxID=683737 RepID=UPI001AEC73E9|nr:hypothetical protein [Paenibacillus uliginis]